MLVKTRHGPAAARHCPAPAEADGAPGYETCLLGPDGRHLPGSCSAELTEAVLRQH